MLRYISGANGNSGDDALLSEDGGINVRALPEDVQAVFADIDANGDGVLDMEEFKTMLSTYAVLRRSNQEGSVSISTLPDKVQPALKVFDQDGDGTVDPKELMRAAELYQASKKSQKRMRKFIIGLVLFVIALIGINSAMTFMMVELGKETKASPDGIMRVNTGDGTKGSVVRTAANGEPAPLTSALPDSAFAELKQFEIKSENGAFLSLMVLGWYRIPDAARSKTGNVVKIITYAGFIILDGAEMTFEEVVGKVFSEAGFDVINGRKLLGMYELIGLFNAIEDWDGLDIEAGEMKPGFGMYDFEMEYTERIPCDDEFNGTDPYGNWHMAAGPECEGDGCPALPEYLDIKHTMLYDADTAAASETISNPEFPTSTLHKYRSPRRIVTEQIDIDSGEAFYCEESDGRMPMNWNVTEAKKVGESLATDGSGKMIRHFTIETAVSELEFAFLTKGSDAPYTGFYNVEYYDEKDSGAPVRFVMPSREFIITKYVEKEIDMPPWESSTWDPSPSCRSGDPNEDLTLPAKMNMNHALFNERDRAIVDAVIEGEIQGINATGLTSPWRSRKLQSFSLLMDMILRMINDIQARAAVAPNCDPEGTCYGNGATTTVFEFNFKKLAFGISAWDAGCGLESIGFEADCPYGSTCYGKCAGTTPALCKSKYDMTCEIGIKINPINSIRDSTIRDALNRFLPNAEAGVKLGYTFASKTVSITAYGSFQAGHMGRRRQMLAAGDAPFSELSSDAYAEWDELEQEAIYQAHKRKLSSYSGDRELLWGKWGIAASVEGTGRYTIPTKQFSFAVSVSGEVCLFFCFGVSASIDTA